MTGLIAILRGVEPGDARAVARAVHDAGFRTIEVPLNSPDPFTSIAAIRDELGPGCRVGAGTVLTVDDVDRAAAAGADVIVSPNTDVRVIEATVAAGMRSHPGVATVSEAFTAIGAGARRLKIFPSTAVGVDGMRAWRSVLPSDVELLPVGGVELDTLAAWAAGGADGAGIGSSLYRPGATAAQVHETARAFVRVWDETGRCAMRIRSVETFTVPPRWLFVRIETDDGVVGWGEPVLEGRAATVAAMVDELSDHLIGQDPRRIEDLWTVMYRGGFYRGGGIHMSALAGIDQALWDIKGRALGVPVHELLGGALRDRIRVYSWIGGDRPDDVARHAADAVARGFTAVKMNGPGELQYLDSHAKLERVVRNVAGVRDAVGADVGIAVDFHGRVHRPMARVLLAALAPYDLMFVEEPVLSEHVDGIADVLRSSPVPIALGERLYSRWDVKSVITSGVVDVIQPDLSHCGGITEVRKVATMAEAYDVALAPHCPLGPIALAACLQVDAVSYNAVIQEQSLGIHYNASNDLLDYLVDRTVLDYADGMVAIPDGPGLGIEIDEAYVRERAAEGHRWRNPVWRHPDGSVAEW